MTFTQKIIAALAKRAGLEALNARDIAHARRHAEHLSTYARKSGHLRHRYHAGRRVAIHSRQIMAALH